MRQCTLIIVYAEPVEADNRECEDRDA
jgi:hypothetical protein